MTATTIPPTSGEPLLLPPPHRSTTDVSWWGMLLLCLTEGSFFVYALMSYFYLSARKGAWPPAGIDRPTLQLPIIMTVVLMSSSATLYWAERGIRRGARGRLMTGTAVTIVLGLLFLALQVREYSDKLRHIVPQTHAYASTFYTTTTVHGLHVAFGLLILLFLLLRTLLGHFTAASHQPVKTMALYWHFVDIVWLLIFTTFYITPLFG